MGPKNSPLPTSPSWTGRPTTTPTPAPAPWSASQRADHERTATRARNAQQKLKTPTAWQKTPGKVIPRPPKSKVVPSKGTRSSGSTEVNAEPETSFSDYSSGYSSSESTSATPEIKAATPDLIQITEEGMSVEVIADLLFEDIGGTEILNIARHDLINGIDIKYQQISNLAKVESTFGGNNLINLQNPIEQIFNKFALKRYQYVPETTDDPSGLDNHVYLDASGSLNIELVNLAENMQIEIEFKTASTTDIIY